MIMIIMIIMITAIVINAIVTNVIMAGLRRGTISPVFPAVRPAAATRSKQYRKGYTARRLNLQYK